MGGPACGGSLVYEAALYFGNPTFIAITGFREPRRADLQICSREARGLRTNRRIRGGSPDAGRGGRADRVLGAARTPVSG